MLDTMYLPLLLAQQQISFLDQARHIAFIFGIFALVFVLPYVLGTLAARALRMRGYEFKIGLIFMTLAISLLVLSRAWDSKDGKFKIPLGVDLKGGVILVYEVDTSGGGESGKSDDQAGGINMSDLVQALTNRINPSGTKEIVIRPYGDRQVEIIIPEVETEEVELIKEKIGTAGRLEFRIVANHRDHAAIIAAAEAQSRGPKRGQKRVMVDKEMVGFWAQAAKEKLKAAELGDTILRNSSTGRFVTLSEIGPIKSNEQGLDAFLKANGLENVDVLLATDDGCNVTGDNLGVVSASTDEYLNPCVNFRLKGEGAKLFSLLTSANRPDMDAQPPFYRHLAIMLDERLLSFPRLITTISDSGRITGDFTKEEVDFLVGILRAGRLPATLKKEPISQNQIGSMLGEDTIRKGKVSIVISLVAVLVFVAVYYRFSGLVACAALLMNLLMIMAMMVMLNAPLTLPGLAGLVLTIGMSVDANVLIFERIREELARGAALRMAIRNGFGRATTTIVDANVTTLITAMVLYAIGTDQIRGFAVTLILGILMSMYTAIFCSRVVFDIAERHHWITQLKMMKILGATKLDFIGRRQIAIGISVVLIVIGLVAVGMRGKGIFDIDFNGGLSVTMVLQETLPPEDVRKRLDEHFKDVSPPVKCLVNSVSVEGRPPETVYKVDADIQDENANVVDVKVLEEAIKAAFRDPNGKSLLQSYVMDFGDLREEPLADSEITGEVDAVPAKTEPKGTQTDGSTSMRSDLPSDTWVAWAGPQDATTKKADVPTTTQESAKPAKGPEPGGQDAAAKKTASSVAKTEGSAAAQDTDATSDGNVKTIAVLTFGDEINAPTLREKIKAAYNHYYAPKDFAKNASKDPNALASKLLDVPDLRVCPNDTFNWEQDSAKSSAKWYISMIVPQTETQHILAQMKTDLADTPVFPSSSKIGGKVAGDTRNLAIAALIASLFGIVGYIWIRFQRVVFGVAAVIALLHDVLLTLGAIAISAYLAKPFGFLLIEEFRISLPIVAAFLTIIGYSLNDTIVVFDRIREVRGKSPDLTSEMINTSINQTLSRTLLTSLTTLIVVAILYAIGGQGIHGFAFALVVGVLVGTYSSIFIASPALLWMFNRSKAA